MVKCYRKPITLSDFWVTTHDKLSDFYASAWQRGDSAVPLLVVRFVLASLALCILIWSLCESPSRYWLLYLTNWGMALLTVTLIAGVAVSICAVIKKPTVDGDTIPGYMSLYWYLFNVSMSLALMISALYWALLFDPSIKKELGMRFFLLEIATHGVNSCLVLVEVLATRMPVRLLHMYQPLGVGLWYPIFSIIYYCAGGTDINGFPFIYPILDWRHPKRSSIVVVLAIVVMMIIYLVLAGIAFVRDKIAEGIFRDKITETMLRATIASVDIAQIDDYMA